MGFVEKITDLQVCKAYKKSKEMDMTVYPSEILHEETGLPEKVCYRACERAERNRYIECGVSLRTGWLTEKGIALLEEEQ